MEPTLSSGDHVIVDKRAYSHQAPRPGDVVVVEGPGGRMIKRVAAVGGDAVGIEDGVLVVNGRPVDEPMVDHRLVDGLYFGPVTVPLGTIYVLGDNRSNSVDSRAFGPVPLDRLIGRVLHDW